MNQFLNLVLIAYVLSVAAPVFADAPVFTSLSDSEVEDVLKDFSALQSFSTVSPPSPLGELFGFEFGVIASAAKAPNIEKLVKVADQNADVPALASAAFIGAISAPFGVKFEVGILPEHKMQDVELSYSAFAIQWTFLREPLDLAIRSHYSTSRLKYNQDISTVPTEMKIDATTMGLQILAGKSFGILEPYGGFGILKTKGGLEGGEVFEAAGVTSSDQDFTGSQVIVGLNLKLLLFKFGLEVGRAYDSTKASIKLSTAF